nr:GNAT family N-acetyltransferase [Streptococcus milleri]
MELLIEQQGIVHFLACIALLNDASISFHKKRGYQQVDHFPKIGYKFGKMAR